MVNSDPLFQETHNLIVFRQIHVFLVIGEFANNLVTLSLYNVGNLRIIFQEVGGNFFGKQFHIFTRKHKHDRWQHVLLFQKITQLVQYMIALDGDIVTLKHLFHVLDF